MGYSIKIVTEKTDLSPHALIENVATGVSCRKKDLCRLV